MEQDKLAALVKMIMADKRIMDLIKNGSCDGTSQVCDLTLIETKDLFETIPFEWRGNVYCPERPDGGDGLISNEAATHREWNKITVYQPSLNVIAKLALGIADEPLLKIVQQKLIEGGEKIELLRLCNLSKIKADSYKKLFLGYIEKIKSYGIKVCENGITEVPGDFPAAVKTRKASADKADAGIWQYKALTERDLLDIEKGTILTVGRKCIVTSLAVDMARRKSIQICREGEVK
ncbi:MAG TPA: hypothetical protein VEA58_10405 [Anaerovoracaceae bacterium]|nr:hypothetical protein [Anaerovoracaceae bacterium]